MTVECDPTYLSSLTDHLAQRWSALGAAIGHYHLDPPAGPFFDAADIDHEEIESVLARSAQEQVPLPFGFDPDGRGVAVPVYMLGRCVGSVACRLPADLADHSESLLDLFVDQVGHLQKTAEQERELTCFSEHLTQNYEELNLIYRLGQHMQITESPEQYFRRFADELIDIIQARTLVIVVPAGDDRDEVIFIAGEPFPAPERLKSAGRYLLELTRHTEDPTLLTDLSTHPSLVNLLGRIECSVMTVPLRTSRKAIGAISAIEKIGDNTFDSANAKLLSSIAEQTVSFLQNRFLVEDLQKLLIALLTSLVNAIDAKDPYTRGHSQRVALIARRVAEELGLDENATTDVYLAGLLHDIGKIGVEDAVLLKPGKLTAEEFQKIRQHPVIGARIISGIKQLRNIIPGVLYHHERCDGSGYPEGRCGDQIPLCGEIVALADCFDAITSERTYRQALEPAQALREIEQMAGTALSRDVVQAFFRWDPKQAEKELWQLSTSNGDNQFLPHLSWLHEHN